MTQMVITANRLRDGSVVYLSGPRCWAPDIVDAVVFENKAAAGGALEAAEQSAAAEHVIAVYAFPVACNDGALAVLSQREKIRIHGPSIQIPAATESPNVPL